MVLASGRGRFGERFRDFDSSTWRPTRSMSANRKSKPSIGFETAASRKVTKKVCSLQVRRQIDPQQEMPFPSAPERDGTVGMEGSGVGGR
jgi:hypothetical protein